MTSACYCYGRVAAAVAIVSAAGTPRLSGTPNVNRFLELQFLQRNDACGALSALGIRAISNCIVANESRVREQKEREREGVLICANAFWDAYVQRDRVLALSRFNALAKISTSIIPVASSTLMAVR